MLSLPMLAPQISNTGDEDSGRTPLQLAQFHTTDGDTAQRFLTGAYTPGWQITEFARGAAITHLRRNTGSVTVDEMAFDGRVHCASQGNDSVIVIQPRQGVLTVDGEPVPAGDTPILIAEGLPCLLQADAARFTVVTVAATLLRRLLSERNTPPPGQIHFLSRYPRSEAGARAWHRALEYLDGSLPSAETVNQPLVLAAAAQSLAAAMFECFASTTRVGHDLLLTAKVSPALRDALSFIEHHAADGIRPRDVAAAVRLTPRAVQHLFRRHLNTTPTEYLRRIRLHRAHQDLLGADRSTSTVAQIAQRCGFAHPGRFAVLYRETYGRSPRASLHQ